MPAKSVAPPLARNPVKGRLLSDLRILPVSPYDKLSLDELLIYRYSAVRQPDMLCIPDDRDALPDRLPDEKLMEYRAPHALRDTVWEVGYNGGAGIGKANASKCESDIVRNFDAQFA
jgi:hypothetical protein